MDFNFSKPAQEHLALVAQMFLVHDFLAADSLPIGFSTIVSLAVSQ